LSFTKHIGDVNGKKVVILQREIPSEMGMASVIYTELLPQEIAGDIDRELMSPEGQQSDNFISVLNRRLGTNGRLIAETLGLNGFVKKVSTSNVTVRPNAKSSVRLDELNRIMQQAGQGAQAQQRLAELESAQGFTVPKPKVAETPVADRIAQLRSSAEAMLEEATRLEALPENKPVKKRRRRPVAAQ
jgi:acylphosphatase